MKDTMTMDGYIATFPKDVQVLLEKIRKTIRTSAHEAIETINYGIPTFQINGKNLVHFAAFKNHIGFYPAPSAIIAFKKDLLSYKQAKGSVQFPLNQPIPFDLIKKIVMFRIKELAKTRKKQ
jgi:uncharacterized protein YdhG (YjbR/CyaY superfamily)